MMGLSTYGSLDLHFCLRSECGFCVLCLRLKCQSPALLRWQERERERERGKSMLSVYLDNNNNNDDDANIKGYKFEEDRFVSPSINIVTSSTIKPILVFSIRNNVSLFTTNSNKFTCSLSLAHFTVPSFFSCFTITTALWWGHSLDKLSLLCTNVTKTELTLGIELITVIEISKFYCSTTVPW